jgi:hypothetical protein
MSEIKTNKISPRRGTTTTIADSGDTVTVSSGVNINNAGTLTVSNLTNSGTLTSTGTLTTAGISGGTINNTTGTISGLQGALSWQTGSIKTAAFTVVANEGYFVNTTSGSITATLPASPTAGAIIGFKDYANTFDTNKLVLNPNGNKIQGLTSNFEATTEGIAIIFLYVDSTKGWLLVDQSKASDIPSNALFVAATGGTVTTCGNFKIHTFTGPGTFCVSDAGNSCGNNKVDYMVIAGGGSGGHGFTNRAFGGGGAGGYRESHCASVSGPYTASPLASSTSLPVSVQGYPITVGAGGARAPWLNQSGNAGSNSVFSTITSAGGATNNGNGGSGGGGSWRGGPVPNDIPGGSGNTPPVSPPQGNGGGQGYVVGSPPGPNPAAAGGGGGGAGAAGSNAPGSRTGGNGGAGTPSEINGTATGRAGGGGGGGNSATATDGGGNGGDVTATSGTANTGGGGGGSGYGAGAAPGTAGSTGGSGIVIIRYKFQ